MCSCRVWKTAFSRDGGRFDREEGLERGEASLLCRHNKRAKERLWMTSAAMRTMYGRTDYTRESQFLRELDSRLLEGDAVYERKSRAFGEGSFESRQSRRKLRSDLSTSSDTPDSRRRKMQRLLQMYSAEAISWHIPNSDRELLWSAQRAW